jgi:hypothetical protein
MFSLRMHEDLLRVLKQFDGMVIENRSNFMFNITAVTKIHFWITHRITILGKV